MKHAKLFKSLATGALILVAAAAQAGPFRMVCSYQYESLSKCAEMTNDIVTERFTAKFPADRFTIFVHSDLHSYSNGGYVAYAVAGVVPTGSLQFPLRRYSTTTFERERRADHLRLAEVEKENFRDAVKQLMDKCDLSPTCDVYVPRTNKP